MTNFFLDPPPLKKIPGYVPGHHVYPQTRTPVDNNIWRKPVCLYHANGMRGTRMVYDHIDGRVSYTRATTIIIDVAATTHRDWKLLLLFISISRLLLRHVPRQYHVRVFGSCRDLFENRSLWGRWGRHPPPPPPNGSGQSVVTVDDCIITSPRRRRRQLYTLYTTALIIITIRIRYWTETAGEEKGII